MFLIIYLTLITAYVMYVIRTIKKGPDSIESLAHELHVQVDAHGQVINPEPKDEAKLLNPLKGGQSS
jgi:hypothetical protein